MRLTPSSGRASVVALSLSLLACGGGAPAVMPSGDAHALIGAPMPDFERTSVSGQAFASRHGALEGRVTVVKFFAKYCAPCVRTLPEAERVHQDRPHAVFLGIDEDDSIEAARELVAKYGLSFLVIFDRDNVLSGRFRVSELPKIFVVDARGIVRWVGGSATTAASLVLAIDAASHDPSRAP